MIEYIVFCTIKILRNVLHRQEPGAARRFSRQLQHPLPPQAECLRRTLIESRPVGSTHEHISNNLNGRGGHWSWDGTNPHIAGDQRLAVELELMAESAIDGIRVEVAAPVLAPRGVVVLLKDVNLKKSKPQLSTSARHHGNKRQTNCLP